ncbi:hypothetical protein H4CHR_01579 [Variovorax sp. PBS-H4]|uniref:hypothetical protein n=1 Tax=Variovorax sp. PBS-H4 TaxID=434008 RepID=UPI001317EE4F|nr:hypothetical protein [Variovorax sp. PBS-H4]VTU25363.1 hypothetical protein H4CHR_01579 [Variovorax sp. PBS-H4]
MKSFLLFIAALVALFSIAPLATWAATGRWRAAVEAARAYGFILGCMALAATVLAIVLLISGAA